MSFNTHKTFDLTDCTTFVEIARAIFVPAMFNTYRIYINQVYLSMSQIDRDMLFANLAINAALSDAYERSNYASEPIVAYESAVEYAKHFQRVCKLHEKPFVMQTNEPCMIWNSPYDHTTICPEEYAFVFALFQLYNDEASFTLAESLDRKSLDTFIHYAKSKIDAHRFNLLTQEYCVAFDPISNHTLILYPPV